MAIGLGGGFAAWMWAVEIWQRPLVLIRLDERGLPVLAVLGLLAAVWVWPAAARTSWRRRLGGWLVLCAATFSLAPMLGRMLAVNALANHETIRTTFDDPSLSPPAPPTGFMAHLRELLDDIGLPEIIPDPGRGYRSGSNFFHQLETSRWPVRRAWLDRMLRDKSDAKGVFENWNHLFPAVVGQDVTLRNRLDLLHRLERHAVDPSLPAAGRDVATLWMGLIVLTDATEFASWRVPVRDAMLAHFNPPMARTGDIWMRVLDVLLAFDPPEEVARLTRPLMDDDMLMCRALRERMRGIDAHLGRILQRMEALGAREIHAPLAMAGDLSAWLKRDPDGPHAAQIQSRLEPMLLRWLTGDPADVMVRRHLGLKSIEIRLSPSVQDRLVVHADHLLEKLTAPRDGWHSLRNEIGHLMVLRIFLDDARRAVVSRRIADLLHDLLSLNGPVAVGEIAKPELQLQLLAGIWEDLPDDQRSELAARARKRWDASASTQSRTWVINGLLAANHWLLPALGFTPEEILGLFFFPREHHFQGDDWVIHAWEQPRFSRNVIQTYLEACVDAAGRRPRSSFRIGTTGTLAFPGDMLSRMNVETMHKTIPELTMETHTLLLMIDLGLAAADILGDDLLPVLHAAPSRFAQMFALDDLTGMARVLDEAGDFQEFRLLLDAHFAEDFTALPGFLSRIAAPQGAYDVAIAHFLRITGSEDLSEQHVDAYQILLALEPHMSPGTQRGFRRALLAWIGQRPRARFETYVMGSRQLGRPAAWRVPWRDDALSAAFSWSGAIRAETDSLLETRDDPSTASAVFRHLTMACEMVQPASQGNLRAPFQLDQVVPADRWITAPPELPLVPTPWQRARALHLRRPDLDFPDRAFFRAS